jgi:thioesterase domain-containing protein
VLLPGMDGTGDLFDPFREAMGARMPHVPIDVVRYSGTELLGYGELERQVRAQLARLPEGEPFVLLGESFSGPLAISIAASPPAAFAAWCCAAASPGAPAPAWR